MKNDDRIPPNPVHTRTRNDKPKYSIEFYGNSYLAETYHPVPSLEVETAEPGITRSTTAVSYTAMPD